MHLPGPPAPALNRFARRGLVSLGLAVALAACGSSVGGPTPSADGAAPGSASASPTAASSGVPPPSTMAPASGSPSLAPASSPAASGAAPTPSLVPTNGIAFAQPLVLPAQQLVAVLVTNTGSMVVSFSTKGTFTDTAGATTATAGGATANLRPGETRVQVLTMDGAPGPTDLLTITADSVVTLQQIPPAATISAQVSFGVPALKPGAVPQLVVPVTNGDSAAHTFVLSSPILRAGRLVGFASGEIDDLAPGATGEASLSVIGSAEPQDSFAPAVDLVS